MTNKEIEKMASRVWDKLIAKPYEIGKSIGEGEKMKSSLELGQNILLVELDSVLNNLKSCGVESINRFVQMILADFESLATAAEINSNKAKTLEEKEVSETTWRNMMAYKINTQKYKLEDMAQIADSMYRKIFAKLNELYPTTHTYFNISSESNKNNDSRVTGFLKIMEEDDIMD